MVKPPDTWDHSCQPGYGPHMTGTLGNMGYNMNVGDGEDGIGRGIPCFSRWSLVGQEYCADSGTSHPGNPLTKL